MAIAPSKPSSSLPDCTYVLLAGLPGTGKSTLAAALAGRLDDSIVLSKDDVRAALFPGAATDYSDAQNDLCMEAILLAAAYLRDRRRYIFLDGRTFSHASHIERVIRAAEDSRASWRILHLWCADEAALARVAAARANHPAADRDAALYLALKQRFEPIRRSNLSIDTGRPLEMCVEESLLYLSR